MKILCLGDLHGKIPKLFTKDFDILIQTGDICGHIEIERFWRSYFKHLKKNPDTKYVGYVKKFFGRRNLDRIEKKSLENGRRVMEWLFI